MKKKTHEEYVNELAVKNPNVEVIGTYVDAKTKIQHRCRKHNIIWDILPSNILKGQGCTKCKYEKMHNNKNLKSHEQYLQEIHVKNPKVIVIGTYINASTPILHRCKYCNNEWLSYPCDILSGKSCKNCSNKMAGIRKRKSHSQYVNDLSVLNSNIEPVEPYINTDTAILHKCKTCGYIWAIKPNHTLSGHGCPKCGFKRSSDIRKKEHGQYVFELLEVNPNIEAIEEYVNYNTSIVHRCKKCNYKWSIDPSHTMRGQGCPICNESHGERQITTWLDHQHIEYKPQYRFDDCRDKYTLPFDFYLPRHNVCIEYNGKQHYEAIDFFGGEEAFNIRQYHDRIKDDYCKNNGIHMLRISYQQDIEEELKKFLLI